MRVTDSRHPRSGGEPAMGYRREDRRRGGDQERHYRPPESIPPGAQRARHAGFGFGWARSGDIYDRSNQQRAPQSGGRYDRSGQDQYEHGLHRFEDEQTDVDAEIGFGEAAERWELDEGGVQFGRGGRSAQPRGPFAGRGPRGYQRADERVREDVCDCLTEASDVDASDIEVSVTDGVVTLSGTISDRAAKRRAEDIADSVRGVKDVQNQLRVQPPTPSDGC
jgi:hypothetical protein